MSYEQCVKIKKFTVSSTAAIARQPELGELILVNNDNNLTVYNGSGIFKTR